MGRIGEMRFSASLMHIECSVRTQEVHFVMPALLSVWPSETYIGQLSAVFSDRFYPNFAIAWGCAGERDDEGY